MNDNEDHGCVLCPDPERRRLPHRPPVCEACRSWLAGMLGDIRILFEEMTAEAEAVPDVRAVDVFLGDGRPAPLLDVVIQAAPAAFVPSPPLGPRSRSIPESRPPLPLDPIDLTSHVRAGTVRERDLAPMIQTRQVEILVRRVDIVVHEREERDGSGEPVVVRERTPVTVEEVQVRTERVLVRDSYGQLVLAPPQDQVGYQPVVTVLDQWVRDWIVARARGEHLPPATVDALTRWLAARLEWACDEYGAVAEFAAEMREVRSVLRLVLGLSDRPEYLTGVPCKNSKCDLRALYRRNGSTWVECGNCPNLLSPDEYADWVQHALGESPSAVEAARRNAM